MSAGGASQILRLKPPLSRFLWLEIVIPFLKAASVIFDRYRTVINSVSYTPPVLGAALKRARLMRFSEWSRLGSDFQGQSFKNSRER